MGEDLTRSPFSAAPSAAGYLYQARMALLLSMSHVNRESNVEVAIERLDDITFESGGTALELLQTKHHLNHEASLTDSSPELWKTLRIWAEAVSADTTIPNRTRLALITTAKADDTSIAALLRPPAAYEPGKRRDPKEAAKRLTEIAQTSTSEKLKPAFKAFLALTDRMRASLLSVVEILDRQPDVSAIQDGLDDSLRILAPKGKIAVVREMLEGWWWPRICSALTSTPTGTIAIAEIEGKIDEIRELLKREALKVDFEDADPSDAELAEYDAFRFIDQLRAIGMGGNRLHWAKRDYYRAFSQRSKWAREHAVNDGELARFEGLLVEEWEPRFEAMCCKNSHLPGHDLELRHAGQSLYQWVETEARFPFRSITARFLNVGSYHILANDARIGWHRDYATLFGRTK